MFAHFPTLGFNQNNINVKEIFIFTFYFTTLYKFRKFTTFSSFKFVVCIVVCDFYFLQSFSKVFKFFGKKQMSTVAPVIDIDPVYTNDKAFLTTVSKILQAHVCMRKISQEEDKQVAALLFLCGYANYTMDSPEDENCYVDVLETNRLLMHANYLHYRLNLFLSTMSVGFLQTQLAAALASRETVHPLITKEEAERTRIVYYRRGNLGDYIDDIEFIVAVNHVLSKFGSDDDEDCKAACSEIEAQVNSCMEELHESVETNPDFSLLFTAAGDKLVNLIMEKAASINAVCFSVLRYLISCRESEMPTSTLTTTEMSTYKCTSDFIFVRRVERIIWKYRIAHRDEFEKEERFVLNHFDYIFGLFELYTLGLKLAESTNYSDEWKNIGAEVVHFKIREFLHDFSLDEQVRKDLDKLCLVREKSGSPLNTASSTASKMVIMVRMLPEIAKYINDLSFLETVNYLCHSTLLLNSEYDNPSNPEWFIAKSLSQVVNSCLGAMAKGRYNDPDSDLKHTGPGDIVQGYFENYNLLLPYHLYCALYICGLKRKNDLVKSKRTKEETKVAKPPEETDSKEGEQNFDAFIPASLLAKMEKEDASFKPEEFRAYEEQLRAKQREILGRP